MGSIPLRYDEKRGVYLYESIRALELKYTLGIGGLSKFYEALKEGKVLATKCTKCNTIYFPPQLDCPKCKSRDYVTWIEVPRRGKLITYTQINVKPASHAHYQDYIIGVGEFNGIKILALILTDDLKKINIGMDIELVVISREPEKNLIYAFKPIR